MSHHTPDRLGYTSDAMESFSQAQWAAWTAYNGADEPFSEYAQMSSYPAYLADSMQAYQAQQHHLAQHQQMSRSTESKPRLSKDEVEILEAEFQKNHKPNSSTKKALAESMRVDNARINNWFQNRRAREKKENNIRQYEARQKMEKDRVGSEDGIRPELSRRKDLVASSAPFPDPRGSSCHLTQTPDLSDAERASETTQESPYDQSDGLTSSEVSLQELSRLSRPDEEGTHFMQLPDHLNDMLLATDGNFEQPESNISLADSDTLLEVSGKGGNYFYGQYGGLDDLEGVSQSTVALKAQFPIDNHILVQHTSQRADGDLMYPGHSPVTDASSQSSPVDPNTQPKNNLPTDIAARRNRRPPPLTINGSRSYSGVAPRMGGDYAKRPDHCRPMRRVASANGSVRIGKLHATPRSPFIERNAEALLQLDRSPTSIGLRGNIAPPTPNTPIVTGQGNRDRAMGSMSHAHDKALSSELTGRDPTLRTPPTTPGVMDGLFSLNSTYDIPISEDGLITPGLGGFPSDFEIPNMTVAVPDYIAAPNGCSSQPDTPSVFPGMGPAYFGYSGGNAEYNWPEVSASGKSSPNQTVHPVHFMNASTANFNI